MKTKRLLVMLLAIMACSIQAWSYRITDNYTIESKFKINALGAGIAFRAYEGINGQICMWQFNVGTEGNKSLFRPHDWKVGGILLAEINTAAKGVTLNTTNWFVTKIVISNNGQHADTYLRRDDQTEFTLIDSRDGNFRFGLVGTRQDHDGNVNESATYDYFKVTANETGDVLYFEDFEATNGDWRNDPIWNETEGTLTTEGRNLSEVKYFPNNMFKDAVKMHYALEADVTIKEGYVSFIFGMNDSGSNYMWQISPNYRNNTGVCNYYHLDNGNESWKAHAAGPDYPDFEEADFWEKRHVMIEVVGNVVNTYIDGQLEDSFVQCDMTDLALLNTGKVGIRVDAGNGVKHEVYVDNVKLTEYDADGNPTVVMEDGFDGGAAHYFELTGKNATYAQVVDLGGDYALYINCDGTTDKSAKVRLIQTDSFVCTHNFVNGICSICDEFQEPGYDIDLSAYTIGNLGQLIRFAQIVNGGEQGANGSLTADIDMENSDKFQPIGLNNDGNWQRPFMGKFYGNKHVISNLYVKTDCEGGLFSRLRGGYIENLGLVNGHIESTANLRCGAMAGEHHDNAKMVNCYARGNFEFVTNHAQKNAMAGETAGGHFINCYTTLPQLSYSYSMGGDQTNSYEDVTAEQAATGEIAYKLGAAFTQDLSQANSYPTFGSKQVILNGSYENVAPTLTLNDANSFGTNSDFDVTSVTMTRTLKGEKWNTFCVPFGMTSEEISAQFGADAKVKELSGATLNGENYNMTFSDASTIEAGKPYMVKVASDVTSISLGNKTIKGDITPATAGDVTFTGVYNNGKAPMGSFIISNNVFYNVDSDVTLKAFRGYITVGSGVKALTFDFDDDATGISLMEDGRSQMEDGAIYNVAGQRINKMQRGINIVNGKKILK